MFLEKLEKKFFFYQRFEKILKNPYNNYIQFGKVSTKCCQVEKKNPPKPLEPGSLETVNSIWLSFNKFQNTPPVGASEGMANSCVPPRDLVVGTYASARRTSAHASRVSRSAQHQARRGRLPHARLGSVGHGWQIDGWPIDQSDHWLL